MYAPAFMMVVISLDRSLAITRPLAVQNKSKLERSMIGLAWILSIVFAGPQVNRYSWTWVDMVILYLTLSQASTSCMAFKTLPLEVREDFNPDRFVFSGQLLNPSEVLLIDSYNEVIAYSTFFHDH